MAFSGEETGKDGQDCKPRHNHEVGLKKSTRMSGISAKNRVNGPKRYTDLIGAKKRLGDQVAVISLMSGSGCPVDEAEAG